MYTRRQFIRNTAAGVGGFLVFGQDVSASPKKPVGETFVQNRELYRAVNGTPSENITKVVELLGGIQKLVSEEAVVVIKPNVQWWNQGAPNLQALKTLVDIVMERPGGFKGEVVIAENCHRGPDPSRSRNAGWANPFEWNSDIPDVRNMNDLSGLLKEQYSNRFSTVHLINVASGARRVFGPADGPGYVYCDGTGGVPLVACENRLNGSERRTTIMTYPIFVTDRGTVVDFKNGIWRKGVYTEQQLCFINLSALNHHSTYCGMTSSIKNYMGITDLSGGPNPHNNGLLTGTYYNFHSFPFNEWAPGPEPGMLGKAIGTFMRTIRKADLNITTAEWTGLSSRTSPPMAHTRAVLASSDPVALDYHSSKYILFPNSGIPFHDPDEKRGPLHQYLAACAEAGGFAPPEGVGSVRSYDLRAKAMQQGPVMTIPGDKVWGSSVKPLLKYFYMKYAGPFYMMT